MLESALVYEDLAAAADTAPILPVHARGLVFEAGGRRLIDGLNLTLRPDMRTVVMGPNGAGKSLTLRLLHGLLEPSAGAILWGGRATNHAIRLRQAMVFQRPVLLRRSALANLTHALRARGVPRRERHTRAGGILAAAGLATLAGTPARLLSGGEQQRLAMARALSLEPDVLFLDEPTANLDPASTFAIEQLMQQAHDQGTKIVLVTHDVGQARRLADEVVFLHRGRLEEQSPAGRFFEAPASAAARAFLEGRLVL
ncbi:MAG TPA: ATP-binding cassette domain-containing protein [Geminicoccaceae bacterium]|nr:ATP-binding cassette domain-containing protein [Geminicoccaceae bacterium]